MMAYVCRSDRESIVSIGIFSNRVMNIWAVAALVVLLVGMYVPAVSQLLHLTALSPIRFLTIAALVIVVILLSELKKLPAVKQQHVFSPQ